MALSYKDFSKEFTLKTYVSLIITKYALVDFFATSPDLSTQEITLIQNLQNYGVTLEEIDQELKLRDFTDKFTDDCARQEVMEAVKVRWDYVTEYNDKLKQYGEY